LHTGIEELAKAFGEQGRSLDILANNAEISDGGTEVEDITEDGWDSMKRAVIPRHKTFESPDGLIASRKQRLPYFGAAALGSSIAVSWFPPPLGISIAVSWFPPRV